MIKKPIMGYKTIKNSFGKKQLRPLVNISIKIGNKADFGERHRWRRGERSVTRYPFEMFQKISEKLKIEVEYIGDWGHPRDQKMLSFHNKVK